MVIAEAGNLFAVNNHRCCAERLLIEEWVRNARRHGVACHATISWVKRKSGGEIVVKRFLHDETPGVSIPCVFCRAEIEKFNLRVVCTIETGKGEIAGQVFKGKLSDSIAPKSVFTGLQKKMLRIQ
jgi:hypothetical protein